MKAVELKRKYLDFFKSKGHIVIPSAPLIPEHDPTVLFTTAGMHPLVPFLMGQPHPKGKRLVDVQKCLRTGDIDDVGDDTHNTFFEMLGNWSLGDYFKQESLAWSYEFLTKVLGFNSEKIHVTVFAGDKDAPRDEEAASIWLGLGVTNIHYLPKEDNWWGPAGEIGPCGPDSEIFIDTGKTKCSKNCKPGCKCAKYVEIWNNVFMQYNKTKEGRYEPLEQKNIDTGMGVERTVAMLQGKKSIYETELFTPLLKIVGADNKSGRIIVDHVRAATFILGDERGVTPSNNDQGYVLRRLIRRAIRHARLINFNKLGLIAKAVIKMYSLDYALLKTKEEFILKELIKEEERFNKTLEKGLRVFDKIVSDKKTIDCKDAFLLFQSYGFPVEMTRELAVERGVKIDLKNFDETCQEHQELSRQGAKQRFKGGLADASEQTIKYHTATHLLGEALRKVLGAGVKQRGSNITPERLRFDFNFERKLTLEEIKKVETLINTQIKKGLLIKSELMTYEQAKKSGAQAEFEHKYGDKVYVYTIGDFSKEVCGGPHAKNTKGLGVFKIIKEESVAAGVRRIKAVLE
ncbi:MAG: alanine--tRNA ligase [Candidatus Nanoarchaeia archaeon]|jgi:alanyl-tRNA synthetase